jgi:hypothetical protein
MASCQLELEAMFASIPVSQLRSMATDQNAVCNKEVGRKWLNILLLIARC